MPRALPWVTSQLDLSRPPPPSPPPLWPNKGFDWSVKMVEAEMAVGGEEGEEGYRRLKMLRPGHSVVSGMSQHLHSSILRPPPLCQLVRSD